MSTAQDDVTESHCCVSITVDCCSPATMDEMEEMARKLRMHNMPGVVEWPKLLRVHDPQRRVEGRSGASARAYGLTDYWVRNKRTGKWMFLEKLKEQEKRRKRWYTLVDYGDWKEAITPAGKKALEEYERDS